MERFPRGRLGRARRLFCNEPVPRPVPEGWVGGAAKRGGFNGQGRLRSFEDSRTVFHHKLTLDQKKIAGPTVHYGFGANVAAIYGTTAELAPLVSTGWGIPFGAAVWLGAHVITVPALGLSEPITHSAPRAEAVEFGAHLVYGAVAEGLRRFLRRRLLR